MNEIDYFGDYFNVILCPLDASTFFILWITWTFDHAFNATIYMHIHPKKLYVYPNMTKFEKV
jgi:hypothetical protein